MLSVMKEVESQPHQMLLLGKEKLLLGGGGVSSRLSAWPVLPEWAGYTLFQRESAFGETTTQSTGAGLSSTSFSGLVLAMQEPLFRQFCVF